MIEVNPNSWEAQQLLLRGMVALSRAEQQGIRIDMDTLRSTKMLAINKMQSLESEFKESRFYRDWVKSTTSPINIYSNDQLQNFLYNVKGIDSPKLTKKSQKGSTDKDTLTKLSKKYNDLSFYENRNKWKKLFDVMDGFERETVDGFMHPFFNLHTTKTFRSSSDSPNFQNIPIRDDVIGPLCRGIIFPRKGHRLLEADFKSIEVGISACYNKDPNLLKYVSDFSTDMHRDMAQQIFLIDKFDKKIHAHSHLRKAAKNGFVFPQFYGDYYKNNAIHLAEKWCSLPEGKWKSGQGIDMIGWEPKFNKFHISDHLINKGITSYNKFEEHLKKIEDHFWNVRFAQYKRWKEKWYNEYLKNGYVDLYTGFRCYGPMDKKQVTNYPVQGAAFHCLLLSFIEVDRISQKEKWNTKLIGQIHDSMILDVDPNEFDHVVETIQYVTSVWLPKQFPWIIVPVVVEMEACEINASWATKEELKINAA